MYKQRLHAEEGLSKTQSQNGRQNSELKQELKQSKDIIKGNEDLKRRRLALREEKENTPSCSYIYLLIEREFIRCKENVFKIGRTRQSNNKRFIAYPKGYNYVTICLNCDDLESSCQTLS
jgi:hypothetical protein